MQQKKILPPLLIITLICIVLFISGIRYGQNVERKNKEIAVQLSLTPRFSPTPYIEPTVEFQTFRHDGCKLEFVQPSFLRVKNVTTNSAQLVSYNQGNEYSIKLDCSDNKKTLNEYDQKIGTSSALVNNQKLRLRSETQKEIIKWYVIDSTKKQATQIIMTKNAVNLLKQTLTFLP